MFFYLSAVIMDEENVKNCSLCCQLSNELQKGSKGCRLEKGLGK